MRNLIWRPDAADQLDATAGFIAERNKAAAEKLEAEVHRVAKMLAERPFIGRPGRIADTREWIVHPNYLLIYGVTDSEVTMLRFLHARQQYP